MFELDSITDVLLCFTLAVGALIVGVFGCLVGRRRIKRKGWVLPLALGAVFGATAVGMATTGKAYFSLLPLVLLSSFFGVLAISRAPLVGLLARRGQVFFQRAWVPSACLFLVGFGLVGWQAYALDRQVARDLHAADLLLAKDYPQGVEPIPGRAALTDKGRAVQMMRLVSKPEAVTPDETTHIHSLGLDLQVIQTGPKDESYNCHGWVFADGRAWISGESVPSILEDNQYHTVSTPIAGDLVVFRNPDAKVFHTAVVRGITDDGGILLESKWGLMGRYVHTLDQHAYRSSQPTFYRSPRTGHRLQDSKDPRRLATDY